MNKTILVTGASSGLGKSISFYLHEKGYTIFGTCRNPEKIQKSFPFTLLPLDLSKEKSIVDFLEELQKHTHSIDVLVNNAGVGITGPSEEISLDEMRNHFEINFFGQLKVIQGILPIMRKNNKGKIINITSIAGYMGLPYRGIYSASKGALNIITESLRLEVADFGIQMATLAPGDYITDIGSRRYHAPVLKGSPYSKYKENLATIQKHVKTGNDPIEVATKVAFLINKKKLKPHYTVGSFLQKFSIILKKFLPQKTYENILRNHYKL